MSLFNFFKKKEQPTQEQSEALDRGLEKTKEGFFSKITKAVVGKSTVDEEVLDDLEEVLIASDVEESDFDESGIVPDGGTVERAQ